MSNLSTLRPKGNSYVNPAGPIRPPSSAGDIVSNILTATALLRAGVPLNDCGLTFLDTSDMIFNGWYSPLINVQNNGLDATSIGWLVVIAKNSVSAGVVNADVRLDGGTNATPSNWGDWDIFQLAGALIGWMRDVYFNLHGREARMGFTGWNFYDNSLTEADVDLILAGTVANAPYASLTMDLSGGTSAPPSATGLADAATLVGNGWTVYTN